MRLATLRHPPVWQTPPSSACPRPPAALAHCVGRPRLPAAGGCCERGAERRAAGRPQRSRCSQGRPLALHPPPLRSQRPHPSRLDVAPQHPALCRTSCVPAGALRVDGERNAAAYGAGATPREILGGGGGPVPAPPEFGDLYDAINEVGAAEIAMILTNCRAVHRRRSRAVCCGSSCRLSRAQTDRADRGGSLVPALAAGCR